ncbi:MAG: redoxin family protein [Chromatiales bacterium]|nr:redoxin family protein [Chromatiales bacterium]
MRGLKWIAGLLAMVLAGPAGAVDETLLESLGVERLDLPGATGVLLWLPGENGFHGRERETIRSVHARGLSVWRVDLHAGAFATPGRGSLHQFDAGAVAGLVDLAARDGRRVFIVAAGRGAAFALRVAREWTLRGDPARPLAGAILFSPNLTADRPEIGRPIEFDPVVDVTRLPVVIVQAHSARLDQFEQLAERLRAGGSAAYRWALDDGAELIYGESGRGPDRSNVLLRAVQMLGRHAGWMDAPHAADDGAPLALPPRSKFDTALTAIEPPREAPGLALADVDGRPLSLDEFRGEVVLLSFWATWCPPCVEELPSMNRLRARLYERGLRVVGVDVGETAAQMRAFLKRVDVAFPNLLDVEASAAARWNVHAFPTSFVIDRDGRIRYGIVGALDWERAENMGPIEALLDKSVGNEKPR